MIFKKSFYFIRHGQTDYNVLKCKVDHEDVSLNQVGFLQAQTIEPFVAELPIRSVCFSPLKRAKETKELITIRLQAVHYEIAQLGECSSQIWKEMTSLGGDALQSSQEPVRDFIQQVLEGVNRALSQEGPVLIVAHGGIHWAVCCLMGIERHEWAIGNCQLVHFSPEQNGQWQAKKLG
ncbi:MAG: histidine phosphatase family protein [Chlamydiales bacterium]|nr:histidine phosphatase family protein [Chlamydiales bacterium]